MKIFDTLKNTVANNSTKKIVFPEGLDIRVLEAASKLNKEKLVEPILLGNKTEIEKLAQENNFDISNIMIIDPENYPDFNQMCEKFVERRNGKNTIQQAKKLLKQVSYFGTMLVYLKLADGMVSGAAHSTADTVRPALQIVKTAPDMKRVSGLFIMERDDEAYIFSDCAMNIDPDSETLSEIAYQASQAANMVGIDPKVAFLSFSTKGSAAGPMVDKVRKAVEIFHNDHSDIQADGELQFDAAIVPSVAAKKAPDSSVAGHANVFVFPELQSGNIGYKIAQRLGKFEAIGPVLQGLAAPINDLSRGASMQDVYNMAILTAAQSINMER